jgi:hypothetical protein
MGVHLFWNVLFLRDAKKNMTIEAEIILSFEFEGDSDGDDVNGGGAKGDNDAVGGASPLSGNEGLRS